MQDFVNKKIVLGICGGIAAYKSAYLVRELTRLGAEVRVVMTKSAQEFITPLTLQALSGNDVRCESFDRQAERAMGHIELARWADYLVIAPATANMMAKMAHGLADDLLSTLYLVSETPVIVCPAMNRSMWQHPATQANSETLRQNGVLIVGPEQGSQACGEEGFGRLSEAAAILNALRLFDIQNSLQGQQVLITAGPTREAIDPVRYITNHSSGKMGYALAEAARVAGAQVTLISGASALPIPEGITFCRVSSSREMYQQVMSRLQQDMIVIGCAAVADYTPVAASTSKIKKEGTETVELQLTVNPDIIAAVAESGKAKYVVGFAAETENVVNYAEKKLHAKKLDMVIANQVGSGMGFDMDYNKVIILTKEGQTVLPMNNKVRLAGQIIAIIGATIQNCATWSR
ncbi:bifunctional phosphopantothenoylcysteine decarboxylase/phosphopantothenate--cysteine ligase CoaBC [Legionella dresdenensis]|uniref:Coenzyme A biosynthesis bifunctional protein CoaBC n=1 Tax=Legionella dresdenensis TaxID=450200 RepID=A0ABV8CFG5_9GAMM